MLGAASLRRSSPLVFQSNRKVIGMAAEYNTGPALLNADPRVVTACRAQPATELLFVVFDLFKFGINHIVGAGGLLLTCSLGCVAGLLRLLGVHLLRQ